MLLFALAAMLAVFAVSNIPFFALGELIFHALGFLAFWSLLGGTAYFFIVLIEASRRAAMPPDEYISPEDEQQRLIDEQNWQEFVKVETERRAAKWKAEEEAQEREEARRELLHRTLLPSYVPPQENRAVVYHQPKPITSRKSQHDVSHQSVRPHSPVDSGYGSDDEVKDPEAQLKEYDNFRASFGAWRTAEATYGWVDSPSGKRPRTEQEAYSLGMVMDFPATTAAVNTQAASTAAPTADDISQTMRNIHATVKDVVSNRLAGQLNSPAAWQSVFRSPDGNRFVATVHSTINAIAVAASQSDRPGVPDFSIPLRELDAVSVTGLDFKDLVELFRRAASFVPDSDVAHVAAALQEAETFFDQWQPAPSSSPFKLPQAQPQPKPLPPAPQPSFAPMFPVAPSGPLAPTGPQQPSPFKLPQAQPQPKPIQPAPQPSFIPMFPAAPSGPLAPPGQQQPSPFKLPQAQPQPKPLPPAPQPSSAPMSPVPPSGPLAPPGPQQPSPFQLLLAQIQRKPLQPAPQPSSAPMIPAAPSGPLAPPGPQQPQQPKQPQPFQPVQPGSDSGKRSSGGASQSTPAPAPQPAPQGPSTPQSQPSQPQPSGNWGGVGIFGGTPQPPFGPALKPAPQPPKPQPFQPQQAAGQGSNTADQWKSQWVLPNGADNVANNKVALTRRLIVLIGCWKKSRFFQSTELEQNQNREALSILAQDITTMRDWLTGSPKVDTLKTDRMTKQEVHEAGVRTEAFKNSFQPFCDLSRDPAFQHIQELKAAAEAVKRLSGLLGMYDWTEWAVM